MIIFYRILLLLPTNIINAKVSEDVCTKHNHVTDLDEKKNWTRSFFLCRLNFNCFFRSQEIKC